MTLHHTAAASPTRHHHTALQCHRTVAQATVLVRVQAAHTDPHRVAHTVAQAEAHPHTVVQVARATARAQVRAQAQALATAVAQDQARRVARTVHQAAAVLADTKPIKAMQSSISNNNSNNNKCPLNQLLRTPKRDPSGVRRISWRLSALI